MLVINKNFNFIKLLLKIEFFGNMESKLIIILEKVIEYKKEIVNILIKVGVNGIV